jgi:hypothetical protein
MDYNLISKLLKTNSIGTFLEKSNITNGNGIKRGTPKRKFHDLIGLPIKESKYIHRYFTPITPDLEKLKEEDVFLEAGRNPNLFLGNKILFKKRTKDETFVNVSLVTEDCCFRDSVNAISFQENNTDFMFLLFAIMNSNLFTYYQFLTSSSWGIYYPDIHKREYLSFPFLTPKKETINQLKILIEDFLVVYKKHYEEFKESFYIDYNTYYKKNPPAKNEIILLQINNIINNLYGIKKPEKDLIDYVLNVSRYQFQESKQHLVSEFMNTDETHYRNRDFVLKEYASVYLNEFKEIYNDEYMQVEIYLLENFIALNFVFSSKKQKNDIIYPKDKKNEKEVLKRLANNLSISQITNAKDPTKNLFIQKDIKGFEDNSFYIIKPNEYKCWHKAMAWYDVAEFKEAIQEAELDELNQDT